MMAGADYQGPVLRQPIITAPPKSSEEVLNKILQGMDDLFFIHNENRGPQQINQHYQSYQGCQQQATDGYGQQPLPPQDARTFAQPSNKREDGSEQEHL